jgi:hypothetical protein
MAAANLAPPAAEANVIPFLGGTTGGPKLPLPPDNPGQSSFEKRVGISTDSLKKLFTSDAPSDGVKRLKNVLRDRLQQSRYKNLREYRIYAAIDEAYNVAFNQTTSTIVHKLLTSRWNSDKELLESLEAWGLREEDLFDCSTCPNTGKTLRTRKDDSLLSRINIPLVKSFITIRTAKIFNDRNGYPFLPYDPIINTAAERAKTEIITQLAQRMSYQYGYPAYLKQVILQTLLYSVALMFPSEVWHTDMTVDENGEPYARKEGLRYSVPHPSRMGYDLNYMPSTFNTDSGCEWACYWRVARYGDILDSPLYYNTGAIPIGTNWFDSKISGSYFTEIYPCTARPARELGAWPTDREDQAAFYAQDDRDKAVFLTEMFCKLVPKIWGLGDYEHPVWFRFVMASDDQIIWAEPFPYCPVLYCGYDADDNRGRNPSMALEILPSQDQLSNLQSQMIGAAKQNLAKVVPYDSDQIGRDDIAKLKSQGENISGIHFLPFSSKKAKVAQVDPSQMFKPIQFPLQSVVELITAQNTIVNMLERLLGMSSSEVGAAGVHIQTAEEIRVISQNMSNRVEYTGFFVDNFIEAWKAQLYYAMREFLDEEFVAQVTASPDYVEPLRKLGFELGETFDGRTEVTGSKTKLVVAGFISARDGKNRINQPQVAQIMMQTLQNLANPVFIQAVGAEQIIELLNQAALLAGAPKDFKIRVKPEAERQQLPGASQGEAAPGTQGASQGAPSGAQPAQAPNPGEQLQQAAQQIQQSAVQEAVKQVAEGIAPALKQTAEQITQVGQLGQQTAQQGQQTAQQVEQLAQITLQIKQALEQMMQQHASIMQAAQQAPPPPPVQAAPPMAPPGMVPPGY